MLLMNNTQETERKNGIQDGWQHCLNVSTCLRIIFKVKISLKLKNWLKTSCKVGKKCFIVRNGIVQVLNEN